MNRANFELKNVKKYTYVCSLHFPEGSNLKYWENSTLTPAPANYQGFENPVPTEASRNTLNNTFNGKRKLVVNQGISIPDHSKRNYFLVSIDKKHMPRPSTGLYQDSWFDCPVITVLISVFYYKGV